MCRISMMGHYLKVPSHNEPAAAGRRKHSFVGYTNAIRNWAAEYRGLNAGLSPLDGILE